jgi:hypothetical protein
MSGRTTTRCWTRTRINKTRPMKFKSRGDFSGGSPTTRTAVALYSHTAGGIPRSLPFCIENTVNAKKVAGRPEFCRFPPLHQIFLGCMFTLRGSCPTTRTAVALYSHTAGGIPRSLPWALVDVTRPPQGSLHNTRAIRISKCSC